MENMLRKFLGYLSHIILPQIITVGVDVQDRRLAAVATLRKGNTNFVLAAGVFELDEHAIENGELKDPRSLVQAIRTFMATVPLRRFLSPSEAVFVLSLPPFHLYTETLFLPLMNEHEIAEAVHLKLEASLPWPLDEAYIDWRSLPTENDGKFGVFAVAIHKPVLNAYLHAFLHEGWRVGACEFHILSLAKFFTEARELNAFIFALIDEDGIEFAVFSGEHIIAHYLQTISRTEDVQPFLEEKIHQLVYHAEGTLGVKVERIFVLDKINREYALTSIEKKTGVPTQLFTPPPNLDPRLFVAQGAALRHYAKTEPTINLVPPEVGGRYHENLLLKTLSLWTHMLVVFSATFTLIFLSVFGFLWNQSRSLIRENQDFVATAETQLTQSKSLIQETIAFNELVAAAERAAQLRSRLAGILAFITSRSEETAVALTRVSATAPRGIVVSATAPTRDATLAFTKLLEESEMFSSVSLPITELAPERDLVINISLTLK